MNRKALTVFTLFALLVLATGIILARVRTNFALGKPGVMIGNVPLYDEDSNIVSQASVLLPELETCFSQTQHVTRDEVNILPPDTMYGRRRYWEKDGFQMFMQVVLMGTDRTSIHKPQYCLTGQGFWIEKTEVTKIPILKPEPYELEVMKMTASTQRKIKDGGFAKVSAIYLYWFVAEDAITPHHGERMWWMAKELITKGVLQRWAYVGVLGHCLPGHEEQLYERMKQLVAEAVPKFQTTTPRNARYADIGLPAEPVLATIGPEPIELP